MSERNMVTALVRRHLPEIKTILNSTGQTRKRKLVCASDRCILAIADALDAVIKKVPLSARQLSGAKAKKRALLTVTSPTSSVATKRRLMVQDGNLIGFIAPLLKSVAGPLLSSVAGPLLGSLLGGGRR